MKLCNFLQLRHFILRVDCQLLRWIQLQDQTGIVLRWLQVLSDNDFSVIHCIRSLHTNADSLSRNPNASTVSEPEDEGQALAEIGQGLLQMDPFDCPFCMFTTNYYDLLKNMSDQHVKTHNQPLPNYQGKTN